MRVPTTELQGRHVRPPGLPQEARSGRHAGCDLSAAPGKATHIGCDLTHVQGGLEAIVQPLVGPAEEPEALQIRIVDSPEIRG